MYMSRNTLGRYSEKNNNEGSSLHKGLLLSEAKQMGYKKLSKATKEELNSLVNGEFKTEEDSDEHYKSILQKIFTRERQKIQKKQDEEYKDTHILNEDETNKYIVDNWNAINNIYSDYTEKNPLSIKMEHLTNRENLEQYRINMIFLRELNEKFKNTDRPPHYKFLTVLDVNTWLNKNKNKISNIDILQPNNIDENKNKNSNNIYTDSMSEVPKKLTKKQKQLIRELIEEFHILNSMKVKNIKINDLNESNVSELKQIAKENNIKGYSTLRKQEIIDLLNEMKNTQFYKGREQTPEEQARDERIMNYVPQPVKSINKKISRDDMINELENKIANYEKNIVKIEKDIEKLNYILDRKKITELEKKIEEYEKLMNQEHTKLMELNKYMY
jgi:hypothetical protein